MTDRPADGGPASPLAGQIAVVTGASQGIGSVIARRLADEGASVALLARSTEKLRHLAEELGSAGFAVRCDVGDPASVRESFRQIAERFGRLNILVNNAGIIGLSLLSDADDDHILQQVATNLAGPILCSRAAVPMLRTAGSGHIVNISSRSVELPRPYLSVYSATKGGLETFSRTLAAELRPDRIWVSAIRVGPVATTEQIVEAPSLERSIVEEWVARGGPAPEPPATPESVADAVIFVVTARPGVRYPVVHLEPT